MRLSNKIQFFRFLLSLAGLGQSLDVEGVELSALTVFDSRIFFYKPAFLTQQGTTYYPSFMLQPELRDSYNQNSDRLSFIPFIRLDLNDKSRSHWDIREMKWLHIGNRWDITAGVGKVFWGVTESRHLVDIINQSDLVENINQEEKLGQPMINVNFTRDYGTFSAYLLPWFRERRFEMYNDRLRFAIPIDNSNPHYDSPLKSWHQDFALRWYHSIGKVDIGIGQFWGTSRESTFDLSVANPLNPMLVPRYNIINQTSLDMQMSQENWLLKLEAITREGQGKRFAAVTTGFEYTISNTYDSGIDIGLLGEYQYDGRDKNPTVAPPLPFYNGAFFGIRLNLNDENDTQFKGGSVQDLATKANYINIEASRRLGATWKVEVNARFFMDAPPSDFVLNGLLRDDYFQLRLAKYF